MSVTDIIRELPKLSPEDRHLLRQELEERYVQDFEETPEITPEMLEAIEEGRRSLREGGGIPIEQVRKEMGL